MKRYDIAVIGAGPAGYAAAIRAAQLGASVALAEAGQPGGACLNNGCVPTKALWHAAGLPYADARKKKDRTLDALRKGLQALIKTYPIDVLAGAAAFTSPTEITVGNTAISCAKAIIATGARPRPLPYLPFDHVRIIDSTDALQLAEAPKTMLIIGGGVIGVELATVFARFGTEIELCEREAGLLPGEDPAIAAEAARSLAKLGVTARVCYLADHVPAEKFEKILVAIGRSPVTDGLGLAAADVAQDKRGISVNDYLQTSAPHIYAAGDVNGRWQLAYTAEQDGVIAAENAIQGNSRAAVYDAVPRVVFSQPVCAAAGVKISEADPVNHRVGTFPFTASGMAFIEGERAGWVKIVSEAATGIVRGGAIAGNRAEDLIGIIALAVRKGLTVDDLARVSFFHPSLSEAVHAAAADAAGHCVVLPPRNPVPGGK